ncbi:MAG: tetratricopeptide repeat protein [Chloroflexota bacterium]
MSKKAKGNKPAVKDLQFSPKQLDLGLEQGTKKLVQEDYKGAIFKLQQVLSLAPPNSSQRVDALRYLGFAQVVQGNYAGAYNFFSEALALAPDDAELLYNRGLAGRHTSRFGQSLLDFERAATLPDSAPFQDKLEGMLESSRELLKHVMKSKEPGFTLEQLLIQENLFQQGIKYQEKEQWPQAEQVFRQLIELGNDLPQPWFNLGMALVMQKRYDEGEAALKRALEIDPDYTLARHNLEQLPEVRRTGVIKSAGIHEPLKAAGVKPRIAFYK